VTQPAPASGPTAAPSTDPVSGPAAPGANPAPGAPGPTPGPAAVPLAACVHCGKPTEHPASTRGATLCPVCEWQEAQRTACSG